MALWSNNDSANGSTIFAPAQLRQAPNTANRDALYQNSTSNGYGDHCVSGVYGVSVDEVQASNGRVAHSGWVLRRAHSGGRANRVQEEVLVAMRSMTGDDLTVTATVDTDVNATTLFILSDGSTQYISVGDLIVNAGNTEVVNTDISARVASVVNSTSFVANVDIIVANGTSTIVLRNADDTAYPDYALVVDAHPSNASGNADADDIVTFTVVGNSVPVGATLSYNWQKYFSGNTTWVDLTDAGAYSNTGTDELSVEANTSNVVSVTVDTDVNATTLFILSSGNTDNLKVGLSITASDNTDVVNTDIDSVIAAIVNTTAFTSNVDIIVANGSADLTITRIGNGEIYRAIVQSANGGAVNAYSSNAVLTVTTA